MTEGPTYVADIEPLTHTEAMRLSARELRRALALMESFSEDDWTRPTECPDWDVRRLCLHVLGATESGASRRELGHQLSTAWGRRRRTGEALEAALSATQVEDRADLSPAELVQRFSQAAPRCLRERNRLPAALRNVVRFPVDAPVSEWWTLGYMVDVIYLRDAWMHRVDASRATDRPITLTAEHDGRIVAEVVREWADRHGKPFLLDLAGPAGGRYASGPDGDGQAMEIDAVQFCRTLSGREVGSGLLSTVVPF